MAGRSAESAKTLSELEESHGGADGSTEQDCLWHLAAGCQCKARPDGRYALRRAHQSKL